MGIGWLFLGCHRQGASRQAFFEELEAVERRMAVLCYGDREDAAFPIILFKRLLKWMIIFLLYKAF